MKMPDVLTANYEDAELTSAFLERFRGSGPEVVSNLPTACTLKGKELRRKDVLELFDKATDCYVYWDSNQELREESIERVMEFWMNREPWEDYDFCVFPKSLSFCLGFTHNHRIILKETKKENNDLQDNLHRSRSGGA